MYGKQDIVADDALERGEAEISEQKKEGGSSAKKLLLCVVGRSCSFVKFTEIPPTDPGHNC